MARRRRNPSGLIEWAKAHPWMTFFLVSTALAIPVQMFALSQKADKPPRPQPAPPLSQPTPPPLPAQVPPALGGGTVFVPGVIDPATGQV